MNDFADWFSPIIVKELRQGLRARAFLGIFLAVQFFMIVCVLVSLGSDSNNSVAPLFWMVIGAGILLAMPMRGLAALQGELKGNTLELMLLTQLSAWRITAGKWLALILQTLLLVCSVLPYVVLRYFLGGVDLVTDLTVLGWMLAGSALLTALGVGLSPYMQSIVGRIALGLLIVMSFSFIPTLLLRATMLGRVGAAPSPLPSAWLWAVSFLGPLLILELFELGVGKIAPLAENHGTRKRLLVAALLAVAVILGRVLHEPGFLLTLAAIAIAPVTLGFLMEETVAIPSLYRTFVRWKFLGRAAGRLLYPGWASGLLFFSAILAAFLWSASFHWSDHDVRFRVLAGLEAVFAPLVFVRLYFRKAKSILPYYFGVQLLLFVTAVILSANFNRTGHSWLWAFIPTIGFFLHLWVSDFTSGHWFPVAGASMISVAVIVASQLVLFILSLKQWKIIGAMEREAALLK
jgi:hypothetical protein